MFEVANVFDVPVLYWRASKSLECFSLEERWFLYDSERQGVLSSAAVVSPRRSGVMAFYSFRLWDYRLWDKMYVNGMIYSLQSCFVCIYTLNLRHSLHVLRTSSQLPARGCWVMMIAKRTVKSATAAPQKYIVIFELGLPFDHRMNTWKFRDVISNGSGSTCIVLSATNRHYWKQ